ncbi:MAG: LacI family transcriptional regulator, partial [Firmicutes bacterium]|nr:LacI family transcriptional regulator [Bacillota bacterium]
MTIVTEPSCAYDSQERVRGFTERIHQGGIFVALVEARRSDLAAGVEAGRRLLSQPNRPTAVFASNELLAIGVMG